ncbi:F5/8 type C domain protein [Dactylonectria macrodidyma]|uniref:F5/8 type C domain protein n=1 Tax=Dactylonectria macrodidyma TaxID=307937 RepID=A0A9P9JMA1_9HYPO|nr:F5/8 type C domain protein [Dactylonectria macrodidyma]
MGASCQVNMAPSFPLRALALTALTNIIAASDVVNARPSAKRGLCFVPSAVHPDDDKVWVQPGSDLTWYYNHGDRPSAAFVGRPQHEFEFIPMMRSVGIDPTDTSFLETIRSLRHDGIDVDHVLGFDEPNVPMHHGGTDIDPATAAKAWVANFEPLVDMGVRLGLPAVTATWDGLPWLRQFLGNCSKMLSHGTNTTKNCTWDVMPIHWYDNFETLASHICERHDIWPDAQIWVTKFTYAYQPLQPTQDFFDRALDYLDRLSPIIGRYAYFGAFRTNDSTVGPNTVFLNDAGGLTDIGLKYLGINGTGVNPRCGTASGTKVMMERMAIASILGVLALTVL